MSIGGQGTHNIRPQGSKNQGFAVQSFSQRLRVRIILGLVQSFSVVWGYGVIWCDVSSDT